MDFTITQYIQLLKSLRHAGYFFQTFEQFIENKHETKCVVLRHDVDRLPENALKIAKVEYKLGISASYYFRVVNHVWNEDIIKQIVSLGHEVAYHYEDLTITKGDYLNAIQHFEKQLTRFRAFYPSKTICMHGSPMSKWDNRNLWQKYNYRDYGIIAEPYFDVDYSQVFYITDTGRAWNNNSVNVRDVVNSGFNINLKNTNHLIDLIKTEKLPGDIIINTHPHRWFNPGIGWCTEFIIQNVKNIVKRMIVRLK